VTVTVVWIAVGRFAGILGLASVTDYLRARTGKRSVLHRSPRHRHRSRGERLRETLRAPQMLQLPLVEEAMGRQPCPCWAGSTPPAPPLMISSRPPSCLHQQSAAASGAPVCWAMYQAPSS